MSNLRLQRWSILNLLAFIGVVIVNTLAVTLPINGISTAAVSDRYPNLFVPAGFTFSIWSVIYSLLLCHVLYGIIVAFRKGPDPQSVKAVSSAKGLFFVSCLLNMGWILLWHHLRIGLTVIVMLSLLIILIMLYLQQQSFKESLNRVNHFFIRIPILVYLGWISVATIANITAMLVYLKWDGFGLEGWAWSCCMIIIAAALGLYFSIRSKDPAYSFVIAWALYGIYSKQESSSLQVAQTAILSCLVVLAGGIYGGYVNISRKQVKKV